MKDSDPIPLYKHLIKELNKRKILFIECMGANGYEKEGVHAKLRPTFNGIWIANVGFDKNSGNEILKFGHADMVSYGTLAVSNNDLPLRFEKDLPLNSIANGGAEIPKFLFGPGPIKEGYTDLTPYKAK